MKFTVGFVTALALVACHATRPASIVTPAAVHLADCRGPATSLPDSLARRLPPRTGRMQPDDRWADLALIVPGGFAGVFYDSTHTPILRLTQPSLAKEAKEALASKLPFPVERAVVQPARWDFAQLVDWFNYLHPRLSIGPVSGDKDEVLNRVRFSVTSIDLRDRLIQALNAMDLPCDLVVVDLNGLTVRY